MHGRIKTRTTAEQERIKKQERERKVEEYKKSMKSLIEMRKSGCYEENSIEVTSNILLRNPDIITVWNYRRETLLHMKEHLEEDEFRKKMEIDLGLTEQCLRINPKSYGSWHHRMWVLCNMPDPKWDVELMLCKRYLELDERNFHCWDYRRFVVLKAKVPDISEYEYTLEKIKVNFSNYSAWHLRSKLLTKIFPDVGNNLPVKEDKHKEELELVENAAFTDPNDQSAWFYQRWLLGLTEPKTHFVCVQIVQDQIIVAVSKNINQCASSNCGAFITVEINNEKVLGNWQSVCNKPQSSIWILKLDFKVIESDEVILYLEESGKLNEKVHLSGLRYIQKQPNFMGIFSSDLKEVLNDELKNIDQLLELEPDSKWTLLTKILIMEAIDANKYENDIISGYKKLTEIDHLRGGYYKDLCSKFITECAIRQFYMKNDICNLPTSTFVLNFKSLTFLYHMQYLMLLEDVDLSCNFLNSESLTSLHYLINCKRLNLDDNKITTLKFLPIMSKLTHISLRKNNIDESCTAYLSSFPNLKEINV